MSKNLFEQYRKEIQEALDRRMLNDALCILENFFYTTSGWPYLEDVLRVKQAYYGLLRCMEMGYQDPSRDEQVQHISRQCYQILHKLEHYNLLLNTNSCFTKAFLECKKENLSHYRQALEQIQISLVMDAGQVSLQEKALKEQEAILHKLFLQLWTTDYFTPEEIQELEQLMGPGLISKSAKIVCLGALMLHEQICPNPAVFLLMLHRVTDSREETEIRILALTDVLLSLGTHETEYLQDKSCSQALEEAFKAEKTQDEVCLILGNLYLSNSGRSILANLEEDVLPILSGIRQATPQQLKEVMKQIQEFVKKGLDMQYLSFFQEKKGSFFKSIENWFYPFDRQHSLTAAFFQDKQNAASDMNLILESSTLCNSDKWSVFLKIEQTHVPLHLSGLSPEEKEQIDQRQSPMTFAKNYMADLHRFYTLFPYRKEFKDPLLQATQPTVEPGLYELLDQKHLMKLLQTLKEASLFQPVLTMAHYMLDKGWYPYESNFLLGQLSEHYLKDDDAALGYYKTAYSLQPGEDVKQALAQCCFKCQDYGQASALFQELLEENPDDCPLIRQTVLSLQMNQETEKVIHLLYKLAYLDEKQNDFVQHELAFCFLREGKAEESWAAFEKIRKRNPEDLLLGGFICWEIQDYKNAIDFLTCYLKKYPDPQKAEESLFIVNQEMQRTIIRNSDLLLILDIARKSS